jgi:hypothetical protein
VHEVTHPPDEFVLDVPADAGSVSVPLAGDPDRYC